MKRAIFLTNFQRNNFYVRFVLPHAFKRRPLGFIFLVRPIGNNLTDFLIGWLMKSACILNISRFNKNHAVTFENDSIKCSANKDIYQL